MVRGPVEVVAACEAALVELSGAFAASAVTGSLEEWAAAVGAAQRVIDVASAVQDAAIVRLAAIEPESNVNGTSRRVCAASGSCHLPTRGSPSSTRRAAEFVPPHLPGKADFAMQSNPTSETCVFLPSHLAGQAARSNIRGVRRGILSRRPVIRRRRRTASPAETTDSCLGSRDSLGRGGGAASWVSAWEKGPVPCCRRK